METKTDLECLAVVAEGQGGGGGLIAHSQMRAGGLQLCHGLRYGGFDPSGLFARLKERKTKN